MNWSTKISLVGTILLVAFVTIWQLPKSIQIVIGAGIGFSVVVLALAIVTYFCLIGWQKLQQERMATKQAGYESEIKRYVTKKDGHGMLHLLDVATGHSQNLTIDARAYRNGHYEEPSLSEARNYALAMAKSQRQIDSVAGQMVIETPVQLLDLLRIFTQVQQAFAIIAGQRVGKSFTGQRIANYWSQAGCKPIWIGPKLNLGEWQNCTIYGGQEDYGKVAHGLRVVEQLAKQRHNDTSKAHETHPIQPVFLDDWTQIRKHLGEYAESFIVDATTLYASVNIVLYFMLHADTVNAWGVGKVGAALHQNFYKLFIEPGINDQGEIDRTKNTGWILMPGQTKKDRKRIDLFSGTGQPVLIPAQVEPIESNDAKFVRLVRNGISRNQASMETWGRAYAGDLVRHGKQLLEEIDR